MIYQAAQGCGLLYGIAAAMIAVFSGWLASVVFSRP
ncbi:TIGR02186 family protein [Salipiger abyssi]|nr:TIGR02186 family protein [Salipiger abyssi]MBN9888681.1 TIGR02186 family protein [Salipiger abyssi]